jgi:hypothetical protein
MNRLPLRRSLSPLHWLRCCLLGRRIATSIWHLRRLNHIGGKR